MLEERRICSRNNKAVFSSNLHVSGKSEQLTYNQNVHDMSSLNSIIVLPEYPPSLCEASVTKTIQAYRSKANTSDLVDIELQ